MERKLLGREKETPRNLHCNPWDICQESFVKYLKVQKNIYERNSLQIISVRLFSTLCFYALKNLIICYTYCQEEVEVNGIMEDKSFVSLRTH
jgi:hypothetical protein